MNINKSQLFAGSAQVEITPRAGIQLAGGVGTFRPAKLVSDPLYAKALVLECNGRKICFVALDVTIINSKYTSKIRRSAEDFGLESDAVMIHATQTHSAPSIGHFLIDDDFEGIPLEFDWVRGGDEEYSNFAVERAVEAIKLANDSLEPVKLSAGSGIEGRFAFNRRGVKKDGSVNMPGSRWQEPLGPTWIKYIEGPIDPELGVVCLRTEEMQMVSIIVNYSCHPVNVFTKPVPIVSADWPGALSDNLRETYGRDCVPIILNGACGNINPWNPFDPEYKPDHLVMGKGLAETSKKIIETLDFINTETIDWKVKHINIPIREVDPEELKRAEEVINKNPEPMWVNSERTQVDWNWMRSAMLCSIELARKRNKYLDYEIQLLRLGDIAFIGLPGEPFVECQLNIKMASIAKLTYIAHATTQYVGYIPTKEAFSRGGHEVATSYWSKLVPEAIDMIVESATILISETFQK